MQQKALLQAERARLTRAPDICFVRASVLTGPTPFPSGMRMVRLRRSVCVSYTFPVMLCHLGIFLGCPLMSESILLRTVWK